MAKKYSKGWFCVGFAMFLLGGIVAVPAPGPLAFLCLVVSVVGVIIMSQNYENYLNCDKGCYSQQEHEKYCLKPEDKDQV
ncbi:SdpI family protein [Pseudomonas sp. MN1F]|uniref:SdpI family protein n=1 Tax=Pseudomonas sp. MN1F TaxID=1366632 RepID=UPI00128ED681|nr:SdpI family protein [Pseudomonas sp. MN1F]MQG92077.1 SdpI family protein [Pseudomonas sp. MN1F]